MADCNDCLSLDRIVTVSIETENVLDQSDFGCMAIITDETVSGVVDSATSNKTYTTFEQVAADWDASTTTYKAAKSAFAQIDKVSQVKVVHAPISAGTALDVTAKLDEAMECVECQGIITPTLLDNQTTHKTFVAGWVEARNGNNFYFAHTSDASNRDANSAGSLSALFSERGFKYTAVYYHATQPYELAAAAMSYGLGQDLDRTGSSFTMAYKTLIGIEPEKMSDAEATAVTGVIPNQGCSKDYGNFGNVYTCIAGVNMLLYGHMCDGNYFDTALLARFLKARIQERVSQLLSTGQVPQTQDGYTSLADEVSFMLSQAQQAGWISGDNRESGQLGYQVYVPSLAQATKADLQCRITSPIQFKATLTGRVHHTSVRGLFQF